MTDTPAHELGDPTDRTPTGSLRSPAHAVLVDGDDIGWVAVHGPAPHVDEWYWGGGVHDYHGAIHELWPRFESREAAAIAVAQKWALAHPDAAALVPAQPIDEAQFIRWCRGAVKDPADPASFAQFEAELLELEALSA